MGKKAGGKGRTPREAKDNLKTAQQLSVIDAIGEGPIQGPVNGLQSILINKTPIVDAQGRHNISGVEVVWRSGEREQAPPEGFESSGAEVPMGVEVKHSNPVTRTITSENVDRLRITLGVQALVETTDKGDQNPTSVRMLVQIQRNGAWATEKDVRLNAKSTSQALFSVTLEALPPRPFTIRVVRVTQDSTTSRLQNKTLWSSYTEIIDVKQRYPGTAIVAMKVDSEQFGGQQVSRTFHIHGRIVQVPSNYDPETRVYTGLWDGTFKPAYSNNPAWCLLDMLTHPRYGMGGRIGMAEVDKWALYAIAQYCDQMVPDGFGGTEPRMTFNAWLIAQRKAWDVLSDFCSAMRCMPVWNGHTLTFVQDRPADKVWTYTNSDVVTSEDGVAFRYAFSALKERHNAVEVNYVDPFNGWQISTELVEDTQAILRDGRNLAKIDAFGCTSRGQAHRAGLWLIKTEQLETQTVDFSVGTQGLRHTPGDIIEICDNDYAGTTVGGRIVDVDTVTRTLTLDREVTLPADGKVTVSLVGGDGVPVSAEITSHPAANTITVNHLPDGVAAYGVWGLRLPGLRRRLFRCMAIRENNNGTYSITALQHVPEKEAVVDNGASFEPLSGSMNSIIPPAVQHLTAQVSAGDGRYLVHATWDTPRVVNGVRFIVQLTRGDGDNRRQSASTTTSDTEYRFTGLDRGEYTLMVRAVNSYGQQGEPASVSFRISAPAAPSRVDVTPGFFAITAVPRLAVYDPTVQFEFWFSDKKITDIRQVESVARYLGTGSLWQASGPHIKPGRDYWFYIRSVNLVGKSVFVEVRARASEDAEGYLALFRGEIDKAHLKALLWEQINNAPLKKDIATISHEVGEVKNDIIQTVSKSLEGQSAAIEQIQRVQKNAQQGLDAMWAVKLQQMKDGRLYIAGIGAGIENAPEGMQSQILMAADRIAMINPTNGNTTPLLVAQGDQLFMNEVLMKRLTAPLITSGGSPPAFMLTPEGRLSARNADISG
ncbi:host specificity protein J, partial [Salmonella enterica]|nr:host specificity protein J [Salmonella enterica]EHZ8204025.1 host specificity protein J [Salmonella enterica]